MFIRAVATCVRPRPVEGSHGLPQQAVQIAKNPFGFPITNSLSLPDRFSACLIVVCSASRHEALNRSCMERRTFWSGLSKVSLQFSRSNDWSELWRNVLVLCDHFYFHSFGRWFGLIPGAALSSDGDIAREKTVLESTTVFFLGAKWPDFGT